MLEVDGRVEPTNRNVVKNIITYYYNWIVANCPAKLGLRAALASHLRNRKYNNYLILKIARNMTLS